MCAESPHQSVMGNKGTVHANRPLVPYALRIAVACQAREVGANYVFLLDEPETHLHPSLLIKIINKLITYFADSQ